jgi:EAL domain-containing protein (putative c-di-GMP-specific phosphodiesterase class I)
MVDGFCAFQTADEWRTWLGGGKVLPLFQPIFSVEDQAVYGWESLGRLDLSGALASLGPFFKTTDEGELVQLKKDVGGELARQVARSAAQFSGARLFFNATPSLLAASFDAQELPYPLQTLVAEGLDPERVVIEVCEEPFYQNFTELKRVLEVLRSQGCVIALDDVGAGKEQLDRMAFLRPDVIKVNLTLFQRSFRDRNFRPSLRALSRLSESLGSVLLVEGIETAEELQQALQLGARYVQGFFFSVPVREPQVDPRVGLVLRQALENFSFIRNRRVQRQVAWENEMLLRLVDIGFSIFEVDGVVHLNEEDLVGLSDFVSRLYFTDIHGFQVSPDYVLHENGAAQDRKDLGKNLSLRPFFFDHIYKLHGRPGGWSLSDVYVDTDTHRCLRTFSRHITSKTILFLDVLWSDFADL